MNKSHKNIIAQIFGTILFIFSINIFAYGFEIENESSIAFKQFVLKSNLSLEDKNLLSNDDFAQDRINELLKEGWEIKEISTEEVTLPEDTEEDENSSQSVYTTRQGKVITYSFVQPTKTKKKYNNKLYHHATEISSRISLLSNFIPSKWSWVASTLFGINTSQFAPYFNNGYQKLEENATYYIKDAYYKEGNRYYIGYEVCAKKIAGTVLSYYRDAANSPHQKSKDFKKTFKSKNYSKGVTTLVRLARKYYNCQLPLFFNPQTYS